MFIMIYNVIRGLSTMYDLYDERSEKEELTIYNVFSLRSDIIPKHIKIQLH